MIFQKKKVFILGKDGLGWSIDKDRFYTKKAIQDLGIKIVNNIISADIIFSVWWTTLLTWKVRIIKRLMKNKKIIAVITDDLSHQEKNFKKLKSIVDIWVYANTSQQKFLLEQKINPKNIFYNPFYVDERIFKDRNLSKKEICKRLNMNYNRVKGKFLIGSFQRDSLGSDLTKQKWQKNPELLIEILKDIDKEKYLLVLAGPRRHYIINKCIQNKIPYLFIGNDIAIKNGKDDIKENTLSLNKIALLYNLVDLYVVTSKSEGGPKAIIESPLSKKPILSTPVGMAPDLLIKDSLCYSRTEFINKFERLIKDTDFRRKIVNGNYQKVSKINNWKSFKKRMGEIICMAKK